MKILFGKSIFLFFCLPIFFLSCQSQTNDSELAQSVVPETQEQTWTQDEEEAKAAVERLLFAAGNHNLEALDDMVLEHANLGVTRLKDGIWQNSVMTIDEYLENAKNRKLSPYFEIASDYTFKISEGRLATVIADNIVHQFGIPKSHEINYFTLMKENENWKFLSISFTVIPITADKKIFDLEIFAKSYAQAWSGKRPEFVAMYFTEDGSLQVNDSDPTIGRDEISEVAKGFMTDLPDMTVSFDTLINKPDGTEFHWTLTATNSGPGGKGNKVKVSGFELWTMSEDGLINTSKGHFPTEEYNRQLKSGSKNN